MNALRLLSRNTHQVGRLNAQARFFQSSSLLLTGKAIDATDKTFNTLLEAKEPIIVDFHAGWCHPCKMLDPVIRKAVEESGAVTLIRVDVDECPEVASKYQIASIPNVMAIHKGKPVDGFVGMLPPKTVQEFVKKQAALA